MVNSQLNKVRRGAEVVFKQRQDPLNIKKATRIEVSQSALSFNVRVTLFPLDDTNGMFLMNSVLCLEPSNCPTLPRRPGFCSGLCGRRGAGRLLRALLLRTCTRFGTHSAQLRTSNRCVDSPHHAGRSDLLVGSSLPVVYSFARRQGTRTRMASRPAARTRTGA